MLSYINANFLHAPSTDLSSPVVHYLDNLVLAQAQEVFLEKVEGEGRGKGKDGEGPGNPGMVSRLAWDAAERYRGLGEEVKEFYGKGIIDANWVQVVNVSLSSFLCA